ncbi:MAG: SDR family NAD(P)-dependent oxidoreductase, partial [Dysgonamonadaceae bacterium]
MKELEELVEISQFYGRDNRFVIAGGGNTSYKNVEKIWVKASGSSLATITEEGFAILDRAKLNEMSEKVYSSNPVEREEEVKNDLAAANLTKDKRPSVETSLHNIIGYAYVVHLHPTLVNALMCSQNAESELRKLFGEKALFVEYTDPGYVLFKKVNEKLKAYRATYNEEPHVIWLQNHGIFVAADTTEEIKALYADIFSTLEKAIKSPLPDGEKPVCRCVSQVLPGIRMMVSKNELKTLKVRNNERIAYFSDHIDHQTDIARPFTPDEIVYCKSNYLFINKDNPDEVLTEAEKVIPTFVEKFGYQPKVLLIKGIGLVAVGDHAKQCEIILDVFEDVMKIAYLAQSFGGAHPMTAEQIDFIDNWEAENYRRKVVSTEKIGRAENKTIVVTGAAQGFGEGISRNLLLEGANIVVADLNEEKGLSTTEYFNSLLKGKGNHALFVKTDVAEIPSLENLIYETICHFGGIDCFISNAGVLRAGGLDEMEPEFFDFVTK